ncbi:MAG: 30S ribosomal protein S4 [Vampirovibrionales bacterium]|nr:30S ribosomal protein S4 [Vampirovibrionales bacterium]
MARYRGSVVKHSRSAGTNLDGSAKTDKALKKRPYAPGQHGQARKKVSEFGVQLKEKQRVKRMYGLIEKQFRKNYEIASRKKGVTGTVMLQRLEARFDNLVFRSGLAKTRRQARQMVAHGHFMVNGKKVDIASCILKVGDVISVREQSKAFFKSIQESHTPLVPHWLDTNFDKLETVYKLSPEREDIDQTIKEALIIEFYSR